MQIKQVITAGGKGGVAIQTDTINTDAIKYLPEPPLNVTALPFRLPVLAQIGSRDRLKPEVVNPKRATLTSY